MPVNWYILCCQVGPYAYEKESIKYDVFFDPVDSSTVTYKEYILLKSVGDRKRARKCSAHWIVVTAN